VFRCGDRARIFNHARCSRTELSRKLEDLTFLAAGLRLAWSFDGDDVAGHGLVGRVAIGVQCEYDDVAHHRSVYETSKGPIGVEVALGWHQPLTSNKSPSIIDSFVNLGRTRGDGCHVDGLLDGVREFLSCARTRIDKTGLVASVAVILTDVIDGNPTKDRLDSLEACAPVSQATSPRLPHGP
jgi:DNA gyrase/topoisomerase IV subunit B